MPLAAFEAVKCTGVDAATETASDNSFFFLSADVVTETPGNYPIRVPNSGSVRSFENWFRLRCTSAPQNYCENFKVWGPQNPPDVPAPDNKLTIYIGAANVGATPTDAISTVATQAVHDSEDGHWEQGNALMFDSDSQKIQNIGDETDYIVLQLDVGAAAAANSMELQLLSYAYEEA